MNLIEFHQEILEKTLRYAVENVPYYKNIAYLQQKQNSVSLQDFPIIDKKLIAENLQKFLVCERFPDYLISTGGTTGDVANITFRNEEEYYAVHKFLTNHDPNQYLELNSIKEFALDIFFNTNGYYWRKPSGWPIVSIALEQLTHAEIIRKYIQDGISINDQWIPARYVQSQNGPLRTLTGYFWIKQFYPRDFGIKSLVCYGSHVSKVWRKRLKDLWGVDVTTMYGLTEFGMGNALLCDHCGGYHYQTAWSEFLTLDKTSSVEKGIAMLILTSLTPFVRVQPRIRYLTGDIVKVLGRCKTTNQTSFHFRGREESSVIVNNNNNYEVLLSEFEIIEVLDNLPDIHCRQHSSEYQLWADTNIPKPPFRMGFPRFKIYPPSIMDVNKKVEIAIEVSFDPSKEKKHVKNLHNQFIEIIHHEFPHLLSKLDSFEIKLDLSFLHKGSLSLKTKGSA